VKLAGDQLVLDTNPRASAAVKFLESNGAARDHGQETRIIEGVVVRITTPAKPVADVDHGVNSRRP